jgi:hypothetical protein
MLFIGNQVTGEVYHVPEKASIQPMVDNPDGRGYSVGKYNGSPIMTIVFKP